MRVSLVTKGGDALGGASRIAAELASAFAARSLGVRLICYRDTPASPEAIVLSPSSVVEKIKNHLDWRLEMLGITRRMMWELGRMRAVGALDSDVIHFHDVFKCVSPRLLARLARTHPVVLTVHDCSPFTGGCLYPVDCEGFASACGSCPQARRIGRFDFTRSNLLLRRRLAKITGTQFVFPSRWIQSQAELALPIEGKSVVIPNGFDPAPYSFPSRQEARERVGLSQTASVVLMGAHTVGNPYKGASFAIRALESVVDLAPTVVVLGHLGHSSASEFQGLQIVAPGFLSDKRLLADYYAAADLLLFPSMADNLPIMIQESMAAATPVLAFRTGGIPEMIDDGVTGWLVERGNEEQLASVLRQVLTHRVPLGMGTAAKQAVQRRYLMEDCVRRHRELYEGVTAKHR